MQLIKNWKEKSLHKREEDVRRLASEYITISDFESRLYIAFQGNPLVVIDEDWPASDVLKKLQEIRDNYIDAKLKD